ncbi:MAG: beta-galactosidase [Bryobacteraceae bacterium]|nr:beta-galactosidase [Bryobacteraceae bacterium]
MQASMAAAGLAILTFAASSVAQQVLVLEDFETDRKSWEGDIAIAARYVSHGSRSGEATFQRGRSAIHLTGFPSDWSAFDRLLFDVYLDRAGEAALTLRIEDDEEPYEASRKLFIQHGWTHVEVPLARLRTVSESRNLRLARIRRFTISADRARLPLTLHIDNLRLTAGEEPAATRSKTAPQNTVSVLDDRFFTVRQVARPEEVPEAAAVAELRRRAQQEVELLGRAIDAARLQGIETIYEERHLVTGQLGLDLRPKLAWFNDDKTKTAMFTYVADACLRARRRLEDALNGNVRLANGDDTQLGEGLMPPLPPLKGRPAQNWFYRDDRGDPLMILSLHSPSRMLERFFATPRQHIESYTVGGGSRWTIEQSPVYEAFHKHSDARRVGWDGWCGHLIRDLDSMGVSKRENVVICLESNHIRKAVEEYIRINIPKFHDNPDLLYDVMAYELMYICYCDASQRAFRDWLRKRHGAIERVNAAWGASFHDFPEIAAPPVKNSRPLPGSNRAQWYDWARFNQDRFTDYLVWVRETIRRIDPGVPLTAGGSSSMLAGRTGTTGIDEEQIINRAGDLILHEGGDSTLGVDLQLALSEKPKPLADPEMSLRSVYDLLPHFLHGKSVSQIYHWPAQPSNEFWSVNRSSIPHSAAYSLEDVDELLRVAVDVRRLRREIAAFVERPAEVAILYSQTSTLQLPPEMLTWRTTPYLAELEKTYESSRYLDARVTFVTERQIRGGWLNRYKVLLVPGARNVPADVVERVWDFAAAGGRVVITPESLEADEYNRPLKALARIGVQVRQVQRPKAGTPGAMAQGYDQSFSEQVEFSDAAGLALKPAAANRPPLKTAGVRQAIAVSAPARSLYAYPNGGPAVVEAPLGSGAVIYSAASLEERDFSRLLDGVFDDAGIARPIRVRSDEGWMIEARLARSGDRTLLYAINFHDQPVRLRLESAGGRIETALDLRGHPPSPGPIAPLAAKQTAIYELPPAW